MVNVKPTFRVSFLPAFFTILACVLVGAIAYRIHSYSAAGRPGADVGSESAPASQRGAGTPATMSQGGSMPGARVNESAAAQETTGQGRLKAAEEKRRRLLAEELARSVPVAPPSRTGGSQAVHTTVAAPPAAPPAGPQKAPQRREPASTPAKIAEPIGKLFGAGSAAEPPAAASKEPKDPTSDTSPPVLITVQFNPSVVHDGEQSTVVVVATDDISGVRNVSASISSPSGKALGAFAFQKDAETSQWVGRAQIPKDAEQGLWRLSFLSMTDNANNTANLTSAAGSIPPTAVLRVISSTSDSTPPALQRVWLDKRAISEGERNTIFIQATDDQSGVNVVGGVFQSPSKIARIGFGCRAPQQGSEVWECDVALPKCVDCGDWTLEQIQLQDKANNQAVYRQNDSNVANVSFNVSGSSCDSTPPVLQAVSLSPATVSNVEDSIVIITATITDNMCGVQNASGALAGPPGDNGQPPRVYFPMSPLGDQPNMFQGKAIIPRTSAKGVWSLVWFTAVDKANNPRTYSVADPVLANAKFTVH